MRKQIIKLTADQLRELDEYKEDKECSISELRRIQAILLVDCNGGQMLIKRLTGFGSKYAFDLRKKYRDCGIGMLKDKRRKKPRALLTLNQRNQILEVITTRSPRDFGFDEDHWRTSILGILIKEQYNVQYKSKTSLYLFFKEAKFTYHKPDKQYHSRDQKKIDQWLKENRLKIEESLSDEKVVLLTADEMMLSTQTTTQKIWLPCGEYPKIDVSNRRQIRCIYGFLNIKTGQEHAFKSMRANSDETCKALDEIGKTYKNNKIFIIWDGAPWHKSAKLKEYLSQTKYNFFLLQLPPYAPELNPQEHVWKKGRDHVSHNTFISDIDKATNQFIRFLNNQAFDYKFL